MFFLAPIPGNVKDGREILGSLGVGSENFGSANGDEAGGSGGRSETVRRTASGDGSFLVNGLSEKPWALAEDAPANVTAAKVIETDMACIIGRDKDQSSETGSPLDGDRREWSSKIGRSVAESVTDRKMEKRVGEMLRTATVPLLRSLARLHVSLVAQFTRTVAGGDDGIDDRAAEPGILQSVDPGDRCPAGAGDAVFEHGRVLARLQHHLGGAQYGLGRQPSCGLSGQPRFNSAVAQRINCHEDIGGA